MVLRNFKLLKRKVTLFLRCSIFLNQWVGLKGVKQNHTTASSWKVMFFGTDDFSLGSLIRLREEMKLGNNISKLEVVSSKWHSNPVRVYSVKENLPVHEWPLDHSVVKGFDIGFVASFGHLIPKAIIDAFPFGILNVHGSLLPRWRGAAPVNYAILSGDRVTGITIMRIQPHTFDKGEILSQKEIPILPTENASNLRRRLSEIGGEELISCLRKLPQCLQEAHPQPEEGVCYAPRITPELGALNFRIMSAVCVHNRYRALYGIIPLFTTWMGLRLSLHDVSVLNSGKCSSSTSGRMTNSGAVQLFKEPPHCTLENGFFLPGQVLLDKKLRFLIVICCDNSCLRVDRLAPFQKKSLNAKDFYNGYLSKTHKSNWIFE